MGTRHAFLPVALAALALLAAGCGGESSAGDDGDGFVVRASTTVTTGPLPRERFVTRVNGICREAWVTILDNFSKWSSWQEPGTPERRLYAESVRSSYVAGVDFHIFDEIYNLGGPEGEEEEVEEVIGAMQTAVEKAQRAVRVPTEARLVALFSEYNRLARAYGLGDCLVEGDNLPTASTPEGLPE